MKKALALLFLSAYLISTTELAQLLKFPMLVAHYFEHKEKKAQISMMEFLALHYEGNHFKGHPHNRDFEHDQKLPFVIHGDVLSLVFVHPQPIFFESLPRMELIEPTEAVFFDGPFVSKQFLSAIWQPPKSC